MTALGALAGRNIGTRWPVLLKAGAVALTLGCWIPGAAADVQFRCPAALSVLQQTVPAYLAALAIPAEDIVQSVDVPAGVLTLTLSTVPDDTRTLDFIARPRFALTTERLGLPAAGGKRRVVSTVSKKEIVLALLQHGRITEFEGDACSVTALADHVGIRQNIVAWAENLNWVWPNGGSARWNRRYWTRGTPNPGVPARAAIMDAFLYQERYSIGCYTATKLVVVQAILDYYRRVRPDPARLRRVEKILLVDGEPLVDVEPSRMWSFEEDYNSKDEHPGKLMSLTAGVALGNFVPGDWGYLLNTDAVSQKYTGYEGSNAVYLGRNLFDDYYNDHRHSYTYEQKLDEVYQWRNGVFSRSRDAGKIRPLAAEQLARLGETPAAGGLQLDIRVGPRHF